MVSMEEPVEIYRIIIIGNSSVGKTSLLNQLTEGVYKDRYKNTLGVDFRTKEIEVNKKRYKLEIWDTAGQERFKSLTVKYYQKADGIIIAFSLINRDSFTVCESWLKSALENCESESAFLLAGCKSDLEEERTVSSEEAIRFAQENGLQYIETSAKNNANVYYLFQTLTKLIKVKIEQKEKYNSVPLSLDKKSSGCC